MSVLPDFTVTEYPSGRVVSFVIYGEPSTQAGMRAMPIKNKAGQILGSRLVTTGGKNLKTWRQEVADVAHRVAEDFGSFAGPVRVLITFQLAMPKSRLKRFKLAGIAPRVGKPDLDKLARACGDSLKSGGLIHDDAQIVVSCHRKVEAWDSWTGATIAVGPVHDEGVPSWLPN